MLRGVRCVDCGYPAVGRRPRCPACHGSLVTVEFKPEGTVWASTVVRVPVPGREPPYGLAYVDVDDGPRVLAGTPGDAALQVGSRVALSEVDGVISAVPTAGR